MGISKLLENGLFIKLEKCTFDVTSVSFLGYTISTEEIALNSAKLDSVASWPVFSCKKDLETFVGFTNFNCEFINEFSTLAAPLYQALKQEPFAWTDSFQKAFDNLKTAFT